MAGKQTGNANPAYQNRFGDGNVVVERTMHVDWSTTMVSHQ